MAVLTGLEKSLDACFALWPRTKPSAAQAHAARLIAHRGAYDARRVENTHAAFEHALQLGCWGIELDVHACKDEILIVNHDPTLQRLWRQQGVIAEYTCTELRALAPDIPTLEEVVARYGKRMHLFIELKNPFTAFAALAKTLAPLTACTDYHLLSLEMELLPQLTQFPKESLLLVPVHNNVKQFCDLSLRQGYGGVLGHYFLLKDSQIANLNKAGQIAGVGFVNSKFSLYRELNRGLRYLFTNKAEEVSHYLHELI
ncbi:glycerophosphodiester phosphodiesterase [Legionella septentrionalis]|uniref:glycerophosphodiester phosphodiesterase n=1 Tax=Legionella septentrionalis TaxID=2498109 RepID=UPI000F8D6091|nr:glycerophosphodiester phosphodiesterase [Legionella septentrionalis]RUR11280.1 glycerophosphodiester phosphodiesterase [Legionella septentrionalis]